MTNLHTVKVEIREGYPPPDYPADVTFTCSGDKSAPCHQYPQCDCEGWDDSHEHPKVAHDECWLQGWFDAGEYAVEYEGEDGTEDPAWPTIPREGPITYAFEGDYVSWGWAA